MSGTFDGLVWKGSTTLGSTTLRDIDLKPQTACARCGVPMRDNSNLRRHVRQCQAKIPGMVFVPSVEWAMDTNAKGRIFADFSTNTSFRVTGTPINSTIISTNTTA